MTLPSLPSALSLGPLREAAQRLRRELGLVGQLALALLALSFAVQQLALDPAQARARRLAEELERHAGQAAPGGASAPLSSKLDTFYAYLQRGEGTTDWLAKLYAIGKATGVELRSATYQTPAAAQTPRIERYEMRLPVSGTYPQVREFIDRALAEIPVLSLDQMTVKRDERRDGVLQAELKMTLHMVKK